MEHRFVSYDLFWQTFCILGVFLFKHKIGGFGIHFPISNKVFVDFSHSDASKVWKVTGKFCSGCVSLAIFAPFVAWILSIWLPYFKLWTVKNSSTSQMTFPVSVQTIRLISFQNREVYIISTFKRLPLEAALCSACDFCFPPFAPLLPSQGSVTSGKEGV